MTDLSHYERLAKINVNDKIEKKNNLSYLSWAWAVDQLLRADPMATWEYRDPVRWNDSVMVFCTVTAFGKAMTAQLPVMDHRNRAIANPDAFQVNTAMQRCLAKAIALHGLGLYIYAGEDLPEGEEAPKEAKKPVPESAKSNFQAAQEATSPELLQTMTDKATEIKDVFDVDGPEIAYERYVEYRDTLDDAQHKAAFRGLFSSEIRTKFQKIYQAEQLKNVPL